ncbi:hypothetical protein V1278_003058 [Bradyrhizobium sp. AZCC 1577]
MTHPHNDIACRAIHDADAGQVKSPTTSFGVSVPQATFRQALESAGDRTKLRGQGEFR